MKFILGIPFFTIINLFIGDSHALSYGPCSGPEMVQLKVHFESWSVPRVQSLKRKLSDQPYFLIENRKKIDWIFGFSSNFTLPLNSNIEFKIAVISIYGGRCSSQQPDTIYVDKNCYLYEGVARTDEAKRTFIRKLYLITPREKRKDLFTSLNCKDILVGIQY